jgi:hypothetical protein
METDTSTPVKNQFTAMFNKVGKETWNKWESFLQDQQENGMHNKPMPTSLQLTLPNRGGGS